MITLQEKKQMYLNEIEVLENKVAKINKQILKETAVDNLFMGLDGGQKADAWSLNEDIIVAGALLKVVELYGLNHTHGVRETLALRLSQSKRILRSERGVASRVHSLNKSLFGNGSASVKPLNSQRVKEIKKSLNLK